MRSSTDIKAFLEKSDIHKAWINNFRTKENEAYFKKAFAKAFHLSGVKTDAKILDAGCGSANHAIRLARQGYSIQAVDFSPSALELAKEKIASLGLQQRIQLQQEDLTKLSFADETFDIVYCWGVLMHIPNIEAAIKELARVVKPDGFLILSENNKNSVDLLLMKAFDKIRGRSHITKKTASGVENWYDVKGDDSKLFVRHLNTNWLTGKLRKWNFARQHRFGGQFTESYIYFSKTGIKQLLHHFNNFWFKYIKTPYGAYSNILIFKKEVDATMR